MKAKSIILVHEMINDIFTYIKVTFWNCISLFLWRSLDLGIRYHCTRVSVGFERHTNSSAIKKRVIVPFFLCHRKDQICIVYNRSITLNGKRMDYSCGLHVFKYLIVPKAYWLSYKHRIYLYDDPHKQWFKVSELMTITPSTKLFRRSMFGDFRNTVSFSFSEMCNPDCCLTFRAYMNNPLVWYGRTQFWKTRHS